MSPRAALFALCLAVAATACAPRAPAAPEPSANPPPAATPAPAPHAGADMPDGSCRAASDCAVKNVGNCCGYYPACVNSSATVDPDAVRAECERSGMASVCGWKDIQGCDCVQGRCQAVDGPIRMDR